MLQSSSALGNDSGGTFSHTLHGIIGKRMYERAHKKRKLCRCMSGKKKGRDPVYFLLGDLQTPELCLTLSTI